MDSDFSNAKIYSDLAGLSQLKISAKERSPEALEEIASQFESLFLQMMLSTMREATQTSELFNSNQMQFYQDFYDKQIALKLGERSNIGIADMIVRQLNANVTDSQKPTELNDLPAPVTFPDNTKAKASGKTVTFDNPEQFITELKPLAEKYGKEIGVSPNVLIAQAALETGWGKHMLSTTNGQSHNLFGIKASSNWQGQSATAKTLEYRDGEMKQESAAFRSYDSFEQSFADYVSFVKSNQRYEKALQNTADEKQYIKELHSAGYATDPNYAEKIISILERDEFKTG